MRQIFDTIMPKPLSSLVSATVLLATVVAPPLSLPFEASSMAVGVFIVAIFYLTIFMALCAPRRSYRRLRRFAVFFNIALIMILIHGVLNYSSNDMFDFSRFLNSYVLLIFFVLGAFALAGLATLLPENIAGFSIRFVFYVLLLSAFVTILGFRAFGNPSAVVFFAENSHYALGLGPFLLYMVVVSTAFKKGFILLLGFLISFGLQSLTLLAAVTFISCIMVRLKILLFSIVTAPAFFLVLDMSYYFSRLDFSYGTTNLSALSFINGWERMYLYLKDSYGCGIGFQQFGIFGNNIDGEFNRILREMGMENLNLLDGSLVAAKFVAEFGIFAVFLLLFYLRHFVRSIKTLREYSFGSEDVGSYKKVFSLCCCVMFAFDLFIRGVGYFSASSFLFMASIIWLMISPRYSMFSREHRSNGGFVSSSQCSIVD